MVLPVDLSTADGRGSFHAASMVWYPNSQHTFSTHLHVYLLAMPGTYHGEPAAIKVLVLDEDTCGGILREVRLAVDMQHPNLVAFRHCAIVNRGSRGQQVRILAAWECI